MNDIFIKIKEGFEVKNYLVGNWLNRGEIVLLFASRGVGKTYISLLMAHSLACKNDFLGDPTNRVRIIYFDGEMGSEAVARRVQKVDNSPVTKNGLVRGWFKTQCLDQCSNSVMWNLADPEIQPLYDRAIRDAKAEVVFIDNINTCSSALSGRDTDFSVWQRVEAWALKKRQQGLTIVFVHHAGKSGEQLGTSQRENVADYVVQLKRSRILSTEGRTNLEWIFTKTRDVPASAVPDKYVEFHINDDQFFIEHELLEDKKAKEAQRLLGQGMTKAEVADKLNLQKWKVTELADKLIPESMTYTPDRYEEDDDTERFF